MARPPGDTPLYERSVASLARNTAAPYLGVGPLLNKSRPRRLTELIPSVRFRCVSERYSEDRFSNVGKWLLAMVHAAPITTFCSCDYHTAALSPTSRHILCAGVTPKAS